MECRSRVADGQHVPGDAGRAAATEDRAKREREATEEQGDEAEPQGEADRPTSGESGRRGRRCRRCSSDRRHERHERERERPSRSGGRPASRARSDASRTASWRRTSRLPRLASPASVPDSARIDHSEVVRTNDEAVLPGEVAAERAEVGNGLAEEVDHLRRQAADQLVDLQAGRGRREDTRDRRAHRERTARRAARAAMMNASRESRIVLP